MTGQPDPHRPAPESETPASTVGFQTGGRRMWLEIALIVGGLLALVVIVVGAARWAASKTTRFIPREVDTTLGEQTWVALAPPGQRCDNPEVQAYVQQLAQPLVAASDGSFQFRFTVVDAPEVNAFALPGGFVTVNLGLLKAAETGEEIAGVLAHEIGHVVLRHGTQRILRQLGGTVVLSALFGGTDIELPTYLVGNLLDTAYSREQESEADEYGMELLKRAGIEAGGLTRFFERMAEQSPQLPGLLSTHPDPGDRARRAARLAENSQVRVHLPAPRDWACH